MCLHQYNLRFLSLRFGVAVKGGKNCIAFLCLFCRARMRSADLAIFKMSLYCRAVCPPEEFK